MRALHPYLAGVRRLTEAQVGVGQPAEPWRPVEIGDDECAATPQHPCRLMHRTLADGGRQLVQPERDRDCVEAPVAEREPACVGANERRIRAARIGRA